MKIAAKILSLVLAAVMVLSTVAFADNMIPVTIKPCTNGSIIVSYDKSGVKESLSSASATTNLKGGTVLTVEANGNTGYEVATLTVNDGTGAKYINPGNYTMPASATSLTFDATFQKKIVTGDIAAVSGYTINAIFSNYYNCQSYYSYKNAGNNLYKNYATYIEGGSSSNSEIISGYYVDLTIQVTDAEFSPGTNSGTDMSNTVSVSTTGGSILKTSAHTTATNGKKVVKTDSGYEITLPGLVYNGASGNLELLVTVGAYNAKVSTTIKNTTANPAKDEDDKKDQTTDAAKPYIIISGYNYGKADLVAGETRNVTMTFYNTSKTIAVENMMVSMTLPDAMMLTSSSNTFYIEKLEAGKSITKTVNVTVKPTAAAQSHAITVNFTYDYMDGSVRKNASTAETISMPVVQVDRFTITGVSLESNIYVGQESSLSVNYVNKGRSDVYNISVKLNCAGVANDGEEQYIGNVTSGNSSSADFFITPTTEGTLSGELVITYEDTNMQERTVTVPFTSSVMNFQDPGMMDPGMDPGMMDPGMDETTQKGIAWYWIVLAVVAVGGGVTFYILKKHKKKELVDEDEDF